jgi:hypothetical protein
MEDIMPKWLIVALSWGGAALAVLCAAALAVVKFVVTTSAAPVKLYWYGLFVGLVAAGIGFIVGRRKTG